LTFSWTNKSHSPIRLHELPTYDQAKKNWDTRLGAAAPGELPGELIAPLTGMNPVIEALVPTTVSLLC